MRAVISIHHAATAVVLALAAALPAAAQAVKQTNLVSDGGAPAANTDSHLVNAWGISTAPGGPFWVSDNGTGLTTVYDSAGHLFGGPLVVTIPPPAGKAGASAPTGQAYNSTAAFKVGGTGVPAFLFATEDGTISGWAPSVNATTAITAVDNSAANAVYKGLALYTGGPAPLLFAANFKAGVVEVYDGSFHLTTTFRDGRLFKSYHPFNVAVLGGKIYVSYAQCCTHHRDDIPGAGHGAVEQVDATGKVLKRIATHGPLNSPWGMAIAPASFGTLAGALLVGNFGDGWVNAFNTSTGAYLGPLTAGGAPLAIPGLWGLQVGNGGLGGSANDVYFSAGPSDEAHGLFGSLAPAP